MNIEKDILCPESLFNHVCQLLSLYFHFSNDRKTKVCCSNDRNYTRTIIFAPSLMRLWSMRNWGWVVCTLDSLGCLQSDAWQELAPAATNLYERNSELLPSRYFEACHLWGKGLMLWFYSLLFTCPGRCETGLAEVAGQAGLAGLDQLDWHGWHGWSAWHGWQGWYGWQG